jgi:hypothetical protein
LDKTKEYNSSKKFKFLTLKYFIISFKIIVEYTSCKYFLITHSSLFFIEKIQGKPQNCKYSSKSSFVTGLFAKVEYSSKERVNILNSMYLHESKVDNSEESIVELLQVIKISIFSK